MHTDASFETLLAAVAQREQQALRVIYDRDGTRLFGVAMAILRDRPAASDAVQDAFLRIWQRAGQYDPARGDARAWIAAIVRHAALDLARARGRETSTDDDSIFDGAVEPDALRVLAASEDGARLRACMERLDGKTAGLIQLAFVHGLSHAQIAGAQGVPLGTVKTIIRRGLAALRECMA